MRVEVIVGDDTVWLTQAQMVDLFGRDLSVVARHIQNVFAEGELARETSLQILQTSPGEMGRPTTLYNLDVVISVGYRVKSKRGTQFRIWATSVLRDHLMRGWTINEKRLLARGVEFDQAVALLTTTLRNQQFVTAEGQAVLEVVRHYARTWRMLRAYDEDQLSSAPGRTSAPTASLDLATARETIRTLRDDMVARGENSGMFGQERGDALDSILLNVEQTVFGEPAYPTVESRAAHLALLRDQGPPAHRRQQTHGVAAVPRLPASEQRAARAHRPAAILRHRPRGPRPARRRERGLAQGPRDPPDPQPAGRGSPVVEVSVRPVFRPLERVDPSAEGAPRISS